MRNAFDSSALRDVMISVFIGVGGALALIVSLCTMNQ
jgi:hypothetical protein